MTATNRESVDISREAVERIAGRLDRQERGTSPFYAPLCGDAADMLRQLRERLDVAERDSQRLDWIASHENIDIKSPAWSWEEPNGGRMALGFWAVQGCDAYGDWGMLGSSINDLREAIDTALATAEGDK